MTPLPPSPAGQSTPPSFGNKLASSHDMKRVRRLLRRSLVLPKVKNYANFCLTLTFMVIRALWGRTETFLLPYLIWRSGQRQDECACPTLCTKFCRGNTLGKHTLRVRLVFLHLSNELNPKSKELSELPPSHVQFTNFT